jgi:hypothetical protein
MAFLVTNKKIFGSNKKSCLLQSSGSPEKLEAEPRPGREAWKRFNRSLTILSKKCKL